MGYTQGVAEAESRRAADAAEAAYREAFHRDISPRRGADGCGAHARAGCRAGRVQRGSAIGARLAVPIYKQIPLGLAVCLCTAHWCNRLSA